MNFSINAIYRFQKYVNVHIMNISKLYVLQKSQIYIKI